MKYVAPKDLEECLARIESEKKKLEEIAKLPDLSKEEIEQESSDCFLELLRLFLVRDNFEKEAVVGAVYPINQ